MHRRLRRALDRSASSLRRVAIAARRSRRSASRVFPDLLAYGAKLGINVADAVLHGGEEYALLFTSSLRESELSTRARRPVYAIGRITQDARSVPERGRSGAAARGARLGSLRVTRRARFDAATAQTKAPMPRDVRTAWARPQFFTSDCERSLG